MKRSARRVLVYEHCTARLAPGEGNQSWHREGRAMLATITADLMSVPGTDVVVCLHPRQPRLSLPTVQTLRTNVREGADRMVRLLARHVEEVVLIAPESEGVLAQLAGAVEASGVRLLGPTAAVMGWVSNKQQLASNLGRWGIPTATWPQLPPGLYPESRVVVKPRSGAGCLNTITCRVSALFEAVAAIQNQGYNGPLVVQPWIPGLAVSVGLLGQAAPALPHSKGTTKGTAPFFSETQPALQSHYTKGRLFAVAAGENLHPGSNIAMLPAGRQFICRQRQGVLSWLSYAGGRMPLAPRWQTRVARLAAVALPLLGDFRGYVGLDLVLGQAEDGTGDRIVEINPRLTTAYLGYSRLFPGKLAPVLLGEQVTGRSHPEPRRERLLYSF